MVLPLAGTVYAWEKSKEVKGPSVAKLRGECVGGQKPPAVAPTAYTSS